MLWRTRWWFATEDGTKRSSRPGNDDQTAEGPTPMPEVPITRVELVDDEPSHGDVPGTAAHDVRKQDAVPDEMELVPEPLPGTRSIGKKPFVLLSHALMADLRMWDSTVKALNEKGYDCIRYDHVGHGGKNGTGRKSEEWKGRRWHFDEFARHMKMIVDRLRPGGGADRRGWMQYGRDVGYEVFDVVSSEARWANEGGMYWRPWVEEFGGKQTKMGRKEEGVQRRGGGGIGKEDGRRKMVSPAGAGWRER